MKTHLPSRIDTSARALLAFGVFVGCASCAVTEGVCAGVGLPGVILTVVEDGTRLNLNDKARVRIVSSRRVDTFVVNPVEVASVTGQAARYEMTVSAPAYSTVVDTVTIQTRREDGCDNPISQRIEIALKPLSKS